MAASAASVLGDDGLWLLVLAHVVVGVPLLRLSSVPDPLATLASVRVAGTSFRGTLT